MLNKSRSNPVKAWKYAVIFPLLASFILLFNTSEVVAQSAERPTSNGTELQLRIDADTTDAELQEQVSLLKEQGITLEFKKIERNGDGKITGIQSTYKDDKGQKGSYSVNGDEPINTFVVTISKEGGTSHISYNTESQSSTPTTMVKIMEGKGAKVTGKGKTRSITAIKSTDSIATTRSYVVSGSKKDRPSLIIMDDEEVSMTTAHSLSPDQIQSVNVLKGEMAVDAHGEAGKNGVMVISTKKDQNGTAQNISVSSRATVSLDTGDKRPLFLIDGKEVDQKQMDGLNPGNIESIEVLKNKKQTRSYGKKGKHGVIKITTKKG